VHSIVRSIACAGAAVTAQSKRVASDKQAWSQSPSQKGAVSSTTWEPQTVRWLLSHQGVDEFGCNPAVASPGAMVLCRTGCTQASSRQLHTSKKKHGNKSILLAIAPSQILRTCSPLENPVNEFRSCSPPQALKGMVAHLVDISQPSS
jgi:hypothetical protein